MRKACCDNKHDMMNMESWSKVEDQKLINYVTAHGEGCWRTLPQAAGLLRCGKSCKKRWFNYLKSDLKRGNFGEDEEDLIIRLHALLGDRWSLIAGRLPRRTEEEIKNYWNSHLSIKLLNMGINRNKHQLGHNIAGTSVAESQAENEQPDNSYVDQEVNSRRLKMSNRITHTRIRKSILSPSDLNLDLTMSISNAEIQVIENLAEVEDLGR